MQLLYKYYKIWKLIFGINSLNHSRRAVFYIKSATASNRSFRQKYEKYFHCYKQQKKYKKIKINPILNQSILTIN